MKQKIAVLLACCMLLSTVAILPSCTDKQDGGQQSEQPASNNIALVKDSQAIYTVVRSNELARSEELYKAASSLKSQLSKATGATVGSATDKTSDNDKEILIGATERAESQQVLSELAFNEYAIKVVGDKLVICGASDAVTVKAVEYFAANYITESATLEIAPDLNVKQAADFSVSSVHNIPFTEMGEVAFRAFDSYHRESNGNLKDTEFWDAAEILEAYLDAYEQTGNAEYLEWAESIAKTKFGGSNRRTNWCRNNAYNDDIAWACIGFARLYTFTGNATYLTISKSNFDTMWERAYSPEVLDGGLWWKDDQKDTKNSCIQCPASIAACLLGKAYGDDSYYEKAKEIMDWEFEKLFDANTGRVKDALRTNGSYNDWASTYNQGTFVGACTLLHEKYGDQKYLDYAQKAVEFGMTKLDNKNGVLSGEASGADLIGFKGILTRWFYRYAEYTENLDILVWLQLNADTAYGNRNSDNWIWTNWAEKTAEGGVWNDDGAENGKYDIWGLSSCIALLHNCQPWW